MPRCVVVKFELDALRTKDFTNVEKFTTRGKVSHVRLRLNILEMNICSEPCIEQMEGVHEQGRVRLTGIAVD